MDARHAAAEGFATATIDLPRPSGAEQARADLLQALEAGKPVDDEIVERLIFPLLEMAVPQWRAALDALLELPEIGGPVGYSGGAIAFGLRLAVDIPRLLPTRLTGLTSDAGADRTGRRGTSEDQRAGRVTDTGRHDRRRTPAVRDVRPSLSSSGG